MQKGKGASNNSKIKGISRSTLSERAYETQKAYILDQSLEPGVRLNIDGLAHDLQIASSPIREALVRLQAETLDVPGLYPAIW